MSYKDFNDYLNQKFFEDEPMTLDDDWIDRFNDWLACVDIEDMIVWADDYAKSKLDSKQEAFEAMVTALKRGLLSEQGRYQDSHLANAFEDALRKAGAI